MPDKTTHPRRDTLAELDAALKRFQAMLPTATDAAHGLRALGKYQLSMTRPRTMDNIATRLRKSIKWDGLLIDEAATELERLAQIEAAARNLVAQKGRYNTQQAYERLAALVTMPAAPTKEPTP